MPGLNAFGRRWMIAGDDLIFPFTATAAVRLVWLLVTFVILIVHHHFQTINESDLLHPTTCGATIGIYLLGYIGILSFSLLLDVSIAFASSRGGILETEKRKNIPLLLYIRIFFWILELGWILIGIKWIFVDNRHCPESTDNIISQAIVSFNILLLLVVLIMMYLFFDTTGKIWYSKESGQSVNRAKYGSVEFSAIIQKKEKKKWTQSLKRLLCCSRVGNSGNDIIEFIARTLSSYMDGYDNLVPSDIIAGLVLLRRHQKYEEAMMVQNATLSPVNDDPHLERYNTVRRHQWTSNETPFDVHSEVEMKALHDVNYFFKYAVAIYGWMFYAFNQCGSPKCCKLFTNMSCCCCRSKHKSRRSVIQGDNCCLCSYGATKLMSEVDDDDIIYITQKSDVFQTPFCVVMDHKRRCVVLSCRGTMSLQDVLTDFMIEADCIPVDGGNPEWLGHRGMISAAEQIVQTLERHHLLERAFNSDPERKTNEYNLVLVGHSLGAGTASILAFLLRPRYPSLICYAFSPPGAVFNDVAATESEAFITSTVVGKDVVGRLSLYTLEDLRHKIVEIIKQTNIPKWKILRGCLCQCMLCCQSTVVRKHEDYLDFEPYELTPFEPSASITRMYLPGKSIHVVKTQSHYPRIFGSKKADYKAMWSSVSDYQSILISNLMWKDHIPYQVINVLETCCQGYKDRQQRATIPDSPSLLRDPSDGLLFVDGQPGDVALASRQDTSPSTVDGHVPYGEDSCEEITAALMHPNERMI